MLGPDLDTNLINSDPRHSFENYYYFKIFCNDNTYDIKGMSVHWSFRVSLLLEDC